MEGEEDTTRVEQNLTLFIYLFIVLYVILILSFNVVYLVWLLFSKILLIIFLHIQCNLNLLILDSFLYLDRNILCESIALGRDTKNDSP